MAAESFTAAEDYSGSAVRSVARKAVRTGHPWDGSDQKYLIASRCGWHARESARAAIECIKDRLHRTHHYAECPFDTKVQTVFSSEMCTYV
jgi:hypothetical protein